MGLEDGNDWLQDDHTKDKKFNCFQKNFITMFDAFGQGGCQELEIGVACSRGKMSRSRHLETFAQRFE